jgi:uncharacterized protein (DUF983 family)
MSDDEAPSEADIEAFGDVTRTCPECKTDVYDEATVCHNCGHAFAGDKSGGLPTWAVFTGVGLVVLFALGMIMM